MDIVPDNQEISSFAQVFTSCNLGSRDLLTLSTGTTAIFINSKYVGLNHVNLTQPSQHTIELSGYQ